MDKRSFKEKLAKILELYAKHQEALSRESLLDVILELIDKEIIGKDLRHSDDATKEGQEMQKDIDAINHKLAKQRKKLK